MTSKFTCNLNLKLIVMMDGINHGWSMGFGWGWIVGLVALIVIVWLIIKVVNQKNNPK